MLVTIILLGRAVFWGLFLLSVFIPIFIFILTIFGDLLFSSPIKKKTPEPVPISVPEPEPEPESEFEKYIESFESTIKFYFYKTITLICDIIKPFIELPYLFICLHMSKIKTTFHIMIGCNVIIPIAFMLFSTQNITEPFFGWFIGALYFFILITLPVWLLSKTIFKLSRFIVNVS